MRATCTELTVTDNRGRQTMRQLTKKYDKDGDKLNYCLQVVRHRDINDTLSMAKTHLNHKVLKKFSLEICENKNE